MPRHSRLVLLLALTAVHALLAEQPAFRIFSTQDGLVRNWVTKIHRDSKGYLWFCTVEGISLYDGYRFTNFGTRDGLPSRLVTDMIETRQGDYWFATQAGLAHFHPNHGKNPAFDAIRVGDTRESNVVNAIYEGRDGIIWCGTAAGIYRFRPQDGESAPHLAPPDGAGRREVNALAEDSRGNLWLATYLGLFRRRPTGEIELVHTPLGAEWTDTILLDKQDRLWAGGFGFAGLDTKTEPPRLLPPESIPARPPGRIVALYSGDRGEIWAGSDAGLVRFRPDASPPDFMAYTPSDAFPIQQIRSIEQDIRHNLWMGVGNRGVLRIPAGSFDLFTRADGLESNEVHGFMESPRGVFYAVTGEWTLNELRGGRFFPIPIRVPRPGITWAGGQVILQDREDAWWAASGDGVLRYAAAMDPRGLKEKAPTQIYSVRDGLPNATILRLFQDSRGDIWAGTADGLGHWSRASGRWQGFRAADLIPGSTGAAAVHSIAEDCSGNVWAGMYPSGLVRFRGTGHELVTREVPRGAINSLLSDKQGRFWIGSSQGGVGRIDNPSASAPHIQRYGLEQGLSSEHTFSLAEDNAGRIYVAGGRGVDRLDPNTTILHHFTVSSGLPPGESQFVFRDREGNIWFASIYGLARYRPGPDQTTDTPAPLLRALRVGGEPYPISELGEPAVTGMNLSPGHDSLEVEFGALHFDTGERLRYQYRLEGAGTDWSKPSDAQTVHYASLSPGRYTFAVRSITESGHISTRQATLTFQVLPVFWRTSWFLGLVVLAIVSGAVSFHRYRLNHLLAMERVRTRLATDLHDDLGAGLAEIAILSEVAKRQERPRTMELLDGIAGQARSLRESMTDIIWTVDPRSDSLADLVLRLRQIAFSMLETDERSVEFLAPADEQLQLELAPAVRRHVLLFFKEVVTNVARHAEATAVRAEIEVARGRFRMSIRDNGRGFDRQQTRAGHGLKSLQYRAAELRGNLRVESVPGGGTEIELRLLLSGRRAVG
jgi:ligand-binding sensor domain-containing protein/signal transduction histidine kinase